MWDLNLKILSGLLWSELFHPLCKCCSRLRDFPPGHISTVEESSRLLSIWELIYHTGFARSGEERTAILCPWFLCLSAFYKVGDIGEKEEAARGLHLSSCVEHGKHAGCWYTWHVRSRLGSKNGFNRNTIDEWSELKISSREKANLVVEREAHTVTKKCVSDPWNHHGRGKTWLLEPFPPLLAVPPWTSDFTSLYLHFLLCKWGSPSLQLAAALQCLRRYTTHLHNAEDVFMNVDSFLPSYCMF